MFVVAKVRDVVEEAPVGGIAIKVGVRSPGGQSDSAEKNTGNRSTKHLLVVEFGSIPL